MGRKESDMTERVSTAHQSAGHFLNGFPSPRVTQGHPEASPRCTAALRGPTKCSIQGGVPLLEAGDSERGFLKSRHPLPRWPQALDLTATPTFLLKAVFWVLLLRVLPVILSPQQNLSFRRMHGS